MKRVAFAIIIITFLGNCKEKYISPAVTSPTGYLVVEGVINAGTGTTNIVLKRTTQLDSTAIVFERGASVFVEGENNTKFNLIESGAGKYSVQGLNLNNSIKYRLHINTKDGKIYQSDFVPVQSTPSIDSVSWKQDSLGVHLFINTHDPTNQSKYYQWDYDETWEFHSAYLKYYKWGPIFTSSGLRYGFTYIDSSQASFDSTVIKCWHEEFSTNIIIGSTISLSENKIYLPINFIPTGSEKISVLYSINTRQFSLSEGKYQYLQKMKKNTESTGTIFDSQPSELKGNIHCISNPGDPVIGYMDICQIHESRIFINNDQLPNWDYRAPCKRYEFLNELYDINLAHSLGYEPIYKGKEPVIGPPPFGSPGTFFYSTPECLDCTLTGTNIKPSFWH
jgi:hypothetical protein